MTGGERRLPRVGVVGLGMIGRHHARLLQASTRAVFAGAVDPAGDRHRSLYDPGMCVSTIAELLSRGRLDGVVVAVPTVAHLAVVRELIEAGVAVLVEKPLAATFEEAREITALCERHGVPGAVGHVERYNPAPRALRRRLLDGQLGELSMVSTVRSGPFSGRIADVGVVLDLATHDIDLIGWLSGSRITRLAAQAQCQSGGEHEDLVFVNGRLDSGAVFNLVADRVSPTKIRRVRVLGTRGMLEADTLSGDLFFYANAEVEIGWTTTQQFRGVSEGDVTRYALAREEPLAVELAAFLDLIDGRSDADVVGLAEGAEVVRVAETILESAREDRALSLSRAS